MLWAEKAILRNVYKNTEKAILLNVSNNKYLYAMSPKTQKKTMLLNVSDHKCLYRIVPFNIISLPFNINM